MARGHALLVSMFLLSSCLVVDEYSPCIRRTLAVSKFAAISGGLASGWGENFREFLGFDPLRRWRQRNNVVEFCLSLDSMEMSLPFIGGLHCRHVGGQNKRKFVHIVCIKMKVNSQRRKILLFLSTNMAAMTSHANHQFMAI